jgi:hypothetical protein
MAARDWSKRREELTKLSEQPIPATRLNTASCVEDLETPLEEAARAAGVTNAELRHAASHPYDAADYLVTMTLLAEDARAARGAAAFAQPTTGESYVALHARVTDRDELLALGNRDYAALTQQALLAGVNQLELRMAREHRFDRIGYLTTLILVAQQENRHQSSALNSMPTRRISMRATRHRQPVQPSWIVERLHSEGIAGTR